MQAARFAIAPVATFACVALGIALGRFAEAMPSWWFALACAAVALAACLSRERCALALALACVLVSAGWSALRLHEASGSTLDALLSHAEPPLGRALVAVEGQILRGPEPVRQRPTPFVVPRFSEGGGTWLRVRVHAVALDDGSMLPARGTLGVAVRSDATHLRIGQQIALVGVYEPAGAALNPGAGEPHLWAKAAGRAGSLVTTAGAIRVLDEPHRLAPIGLLDGLRRWTGSALPAGDDAAGRVVRAIVLGERDPGDPLQQAFARIGVSHLLAISGFHVGALALGIVWLVRLTGERGRLEVALVLLAVGLYMLVLPVRAPIVRAGIMVFALVLARSRGRRLDAMGVLAWAGVVVLIARPMELFTLGFQLSFGVTAALVWAMPRLQQRLQGQPLAGLLELHEPSPWQRLRQRSINAVTLATLCWLVALPAVLLHAQTLSPLSVPATLALTPLVLVALALGFASLGFASVWPAAGDAIGGMARAVGEQLAWLASAIDRIPLSAITLPAPPIAWTIAATIVVFWLAWELGAARLEARAQHRRAAWAASGALAAWLAGAWLFAASARPVLRIDMLAVGDGTCVLIRSGGSALLWDCGSVDLSIGPELSRSLRALGAWRVPDAVVTHPNVDHYAALLDVAPAIGLERLWTTRTFIERAAEHGSNEAVLLEGLAGLGVEVRELAAGAELSIANATLSVLWPPAGATFERPNDSSLVARLAVPTHSGERRVLLTGDIQRDAMRALLADTAIDLRADAIELPHHGGWQPLAAAFVERAAPAIVLQSTGPSRVGDERWMGARTGRWWGITARDGMLTLEVEQDGSLRASRLLDEPASRSTVR